MDGALPDLSDFARETGTVVVYRKFANFGNVQNKFKTFKNRKSNRRTHGKPMLFIIDNSLKEKKVLKTCVQFESFCVLWLHDTTMNS